MRSHARLQITLIPSMLDISSSVAKRMHIPIYIIDANPASISTTNHPPYKIPINTRMHYTSHILAKYAFVEVPLVAVDTNPVKLDAETTYTERKMLTMTWEEVMALALVHQFTPVGHKDREKALAGNARINSGQASDGATSPKRRADNKLVNPYVHDQDKGKPHQFHPLSVHHNHDSLPVTPWILALHD
jgi:hypothetical protein